MSTSTTKIIPCSCHNEFQDKKYGKTRRVHNLTQRGTKDNPKYRCTVCKNEK